MSLLERIFATKKLYEYQNLAARYKVWHGAPYEMISFQDGQLVMIDGDFLLDKMDILWRDMNWFEKRIADRWAKKYAILPE